MLVIMTEPFSTMQESDAPLVTAPDGSNVRPLAVLAGAASFATFELAAGQVSAAVSHRTVQEIWYVVAGGGQMWRSQAGRDEVTPVGPGVCVTIPLGTSFQFRAGADGLRVAAVTVPPWPDSPDEAVPEPGAW
jgi:mannose-6-phosphate isomerase-like protein (cupin superfamily)